MKTIKLILKALLLYNTVLFCMLTILALDTIIITIWMPVAILIAIALISTCYYTISSEELDKISLINLL